ncbi:transcription initiation factor IID, 18kD subunit-domain-containing protein, partial [Crepidotus variabilis]
TATYPYSAYHHPSYATTPGGYTYATGYQTGVTSYGWTYPYTYLQQHNAQAAAAAAAAAASAQAHFSRPTGAMTIPAASGSYSGSTGSGTVGSTPHPSLPQRSTTFSAYTPNYARDTYTGKGSKRQSNMRGLFTKDLRNLMYGFGDDRNPSNDTVNVMEEILIEYITDVCQQAAGPTKKARLSIDDLRRVLSNPADAKKLARLEELLFMQEDIKRARAQFDDNE